MILHVIYLHILADDDDVWNLPNDDDDDVWKYTSDLATLVASSARLPGTDARLKVLPKCPKSNLFIDCHCH